MSAEYSIDNKYQVFTLNLSNGITNLEINTLIKSNFLTTFFVDNNGDSIGDGKIFISFVAKNNYPLTFLNGSKYKSQYQKFYVNAPAQPNINVRIFTSLDSYYEKETQITNALLSASGSGITVTTEPINYDIDSLGGELNNQLVTININNTLIPNAKSIKSILITNLDNNHNLYFGKNFNNSTYQNKALPILAGEKLSIDFNPIAKLPYNFLLYSPDNIKYQITTSYTL